MLHNIYLKLVDIVIYTIAQLYDIIDIKTTGNNKKINNRYNANIKKMIRVTRYLGLKYNSTIMSLNRNKLYDLLRVVILRNIYKGSISQSYIMTLHYNIRTSCKTFH